MALGQVALLKNLASVVLTEMQQPPLAESIRLRAVLSAALLRLFCGLNCQSGMVGLRALCSVPAKVENGHSGKMLQLEGGSRLF